MLAADLVRRGALRHRDRVAVQVAGEAMTYAEVMDLAERFASSLLSLGLTPGTPVAVLLDNGRYSMPLDFALLLGGFVRVPLNSRLAAAEHAQMVTHLKCPVVLYESAHAARVKEIAGLVPSAPAAIPVDEGDGPQAPLIRLAADQPATGSMVAAQPGDPMLAIYTSGTTGALKAVVHTQASWAAITANVLANVISPGPGDAMLHAASLLHASGTFVLPYWLRGGRSVVLPGFTPGSWLDAVERYQVTAANLVPTMIQMLLAASPGESALRTLDSLMYGASPMPRPVIDAALSQWGPRFVQYYGQTEAPLSITVLAKEDHAGELLGSCGQPAVDAEVRLVDGAGREVPDGEQGELQVRAPFAMRGYHDAPELTAKTVLPGGWIATRDVARRDDRGYLYLVDRTSDMIVTGGYNVYPREVEDALLAHPDVREAAVVAAPDEKWVEAVTAFVVLAPGRAVDEPALRDYVRTRLAGYKVPKQVHVVGQIPKSAVGKVLRRALRDPLWAGQHRTERL
jgi:acyl-CoA synthetase (AMP-forming)/AMP-acid ligase II